MKGKLIVFEGTDGSGKATQASLLDQRLKSLKIPYELISFPRYSDNPYGNLIKRYLEGEFGGIDTVDSHLISLAYASDRFLAKPILEKWLGEGKLVLIDRYVSSNKAHLGGRFTGEKKDQFIKWLDNLEYKVNGLPKENLVIFLYVPAEMAQENVSKEGKKDLHEKDIKHLKKSNEIYLELSKDKNWVVINCTKKGKMRSKEEIHQEILIILKDKRILPS